MKTIVLFHLVFSTPTLIVIRVVVAPGLVVLVIGVTVIVVAGRANV